MTPVLCKEVLMAPITWDPRTCAPLPVVPTAPGGFEDLRKVKEKLALTLQIIQPGWDGVRELPKEASVCGGLIPVQWPLRNLSLGENRGSRSTWPGEKSPYSFQTCPHRLQAKNVHSSIYYISKITPRSGEGGAGPGLGAGKDVVGGQAGRKPLIQCLEPRLAPWAAGRECPFSRC